MTKEPTLRDLAQAVSEVKALRERNKRRNNPETTEVKETNNLLGGAGGKESLVPLRLREKKEAK